MIRLERWAGVRSWKVLLIMPWRLGFTQPAPSVFLFTSCHRTDSWGAPCPCSGSPVVLLMVMDNRMSIEALAFHVLESPKMQGIFLNLPPSQIIKKKSENARQRAKIRTGIRAMITLTTEMQRGKLIGSVLRGPSVPGKPWE